MDIFFLFFNVQCLPDSVEPAIFYVKRFGCKTQCNGSLFKALMALGPKKGEKCVTLNGEKELSLKTFDENSPHPDTIFIITEVLPKNEV